MNLCTSSGQKTAWGSKFLRTLVPFYQKSRMSRSGKPFACTTRNRITFYKIQEHKLRNSLSEHVDKSTKKQKLPKISNATNHTDKESSKHHLDKCNWRDCSSDFVTWWWWRRWWWRWCGGGGGSGSDDDDVNDNDNSLRNIMFHEYSFITVTIRSWLHFRRTKIWLGFINFSSSPHR